MRSNLNLHTARPLHPPLHAWLAADIDPGPPSLHASADPEVAGEPGVQLDSELDQLCIGVIGLGYVGLPLATEFGRRYATVGFDLDSRRIGELRQSHDRTREVSEQALRKSPWLSFADDARALKGCDVLIVAVPTPVDEFNQPDLTALKSASAIAGSALRPGGLVVFESTVYPGATEEVCAPIIAERSGLVLHHGFHLGYSPERINPGDAHRRVTDIVKLTSGSSPAAADLVDRLYASIIPAGTHRASSIRVAEAAKVIENTQRDVNIALVNELAMLFHRMGIDTGEVLAAAGTKWNFLPFQPGLVGGHCVGVDPYYLTSKAQQIGFHPAMILAGRRINDAMGAYVASRVVKLMVQRSTQLVGARILVLGLAFKENCPDLRNTRVIDVIRELADHGAVIDVCDPWADADEAEQAYGLSMVAEPEAGCYDAVVIAVAHRQFAALGAAHIRAWARPEGIVFDVKHLLDAEHTDGRL